MDTAAREAAPQLRLLLPAATAWATTAALLTTGPRHAPAVLVTAAVAAAGALLLLHRPSRHPRPRHARPRHALAAVLLTASAAALTTTLHSADLRRGPLPELARPGAGPAPTATVRLTVTGDPEGHRGTLVVLRATADRVTVHGTTTATRTPVTVIAQGPSAADWLGLLPSARVGAEVRVLPPAQPGEPIAAVLLTRGPPVRLGPPDLPQRIAGRLRAGLRRACAPLPADARALLPGLVVGDTSGIPEDLHDAFRATDLTHILAVSGANLGKGC